jgi:acetyl esterase/lipase
MSALSLKRSGALSACALGIALSGCSSTGASSATASSGTDSDASYSGYLLDGATSYALDATSAASDATIDGSGTLPTGDAPSNVSVADAARANDASTEASATIDSSLGADSGPLLPPVSDTTSTLGISAPGPGYHVEGNIPYGPFTMQRLDVMYPNGAGPNGTTTLPGVIMFHGGGWTDDRPQALKASMSSFFDRFLAHGFLVCNVEYRLADGTANGAIAPAADQDALLAAKWFWEYMDYYHVDKTRYVVTGASAGGQLALMVGMATPAAKLGPTSPTDYTIAAIVNGYGPSDVTDLLAKNISWAVQWLPANTPNRAALAIRVSPVTYVRKDVPPLITVQGADDTTVPITESQNLFNLLTAAGADTALHFVAGAGHGFDTPATAWPDAEAAMFGFLTARGIGM